MRGQRSDRLTLEADLRRGLERGEIKTFFQPIVRLEDRTIAGFETLLRWDHPRLGRLNPTEFWPVAEQTGLVVDLGLMALEVGGRLGVRAPDLGAAVLAWGDRVALLATGDIRGALDGIAMTTGLPGGAPTRAAECAAWVAQTPEALELVTFAVSEAYFSARNQTGIDS